MEFFLNDSTLKDDVPNDYLSHQELYEQSIRKTCIMLKKMEEWMVLSNDDMEDIILYV